MNIRNLLSLSLLLAATAGLAQDSAQSELKLDLLPNEGWWGGAVTLGTKMPYGVAPIDINLDGDNRGNQYAPLLVSSKGRYVWCEKAFRFAFKDKSLRVTSAGNTFRHGQAGRDLRDAYRHAAKSFFPTDGKLPDRALFAMPQDNTWTRHLEARGPATRATPPRQEPQLGRPRTTHPRHDRRRADGLHVCLSRSDRRRRIYLLPQSGDH